MADIKKKKTMEIPLTFGDHVRFIKGVTKYTTCGDVIKMVLRKLDIKKENGGSEAFGIYESSRGIDRLLPSKCKLVKVMRSWGTDNNYELIFRKVSTAFPISKASASKRRKTTARKENSPHPSNVFAVNQNGNKNKHLHVHKAVKELYFNGDSDSSMEEFMSSVDPTNMAEILNFCGNIASQEMTRLSTSTASDEPNFSRNVTGQSAELQDDDDSLVRSQTDASHNNARCVKYAVKKSLKKKTSTATQNNAVSRGICDANVAVKRHMELASNITSKVARINQREGKEALLQKYFADYIMYQSPGDKCLDTRFRTRGDGAEASIHSSDVRSSGVGAEYSGLTPTRNNNIIRRTTLSFETTVNDTTNTLNDSNGLDNAFISDDVNDSGHVDSYTNFQKVDKLVDYSLSEDDSVLTDPSDISTCSEPENVHNVSCVSDIVKHLFHETGSGSEDDDMESFMMTKIIDENDPDLSDEGLSSLGSDDEYALL